MLSQTTRIIVTLPVYKDTRFLKEAIERLEEITGEIAPSFKLLIPEDGSDSTELVNELRSKYSNITHLQHDQRLGRGRALRDAWRNVEGDIYVYIDVDMATDLAKFNAYRNLIENQSNYDLVTGSRYITGSETNRPRLRRLASLGYNWFVSLLFGTGIHDHQCGFKSFSRPLIEKLTVAAKSDTWFWDTEVIVLARNLGFRILEIPIHWTEKKGQKTPIRRLAKDAWVHGSGVLSLLWRVYFGS